MDDAKTTGKAQGQSYNEWEASVYASYAQFLKGVSEENLIRLGQKYRALSKRRVRGRIIEARAKLAACMAEWRRRHPETGSE